MSIGESGGEYFQVSFDNEDPSDDDLDLSPPDQPYLLVQRQFEDDDGGVCYIETLDHDTYTGHYRLRLIEFTPTRLTFEIVRKHHKYVEVTSTSTRSVSVKSNASCASFWAREPGRRRLAKGDGWVAPCEICHRKDRKADHRPRMMVILSNQEHDHVRQRSPPVEKPNPHALEQGQADRREATAATKPRLVHQNAANG